MATIRDGKQSALVVVDVQVGVMAEAWDAARVIGNIVQVVRRARAAGMPVIWVQHSSDELPLGSAAWQWVPELDPQAGERLVPKQFNSSFEQTALDDELARLGVSHLVLAGAASNWCIRATAYGALDRGYDLTLVSDAHTTGSTALDDGFTIEAESVVRDLNMAFTWLSYPGRSTRAVKASDLAFTSA